jgi:hypothetical protein
MKTLTIEQKTGMVRKLILLRIEGFAGRERILIRDLFLPGGSLPMPRDGWKLADVFIRPAWGCAAGYR